MIAYYRRRLVVAGKDDRPNLLRYSNTDLESDYGVEDFEQYNDGTAGNMSVGDQNPITGLVEFR